MKRLFNTFVIILFSFSPLFAQASSDLVSIARYKGDKICAISYTFDDGLAEHYTHAAPELEKRGFRGTFWINGAKVNEENAESPDTTRVNWQQLREMIAAGHEISNHGWAHRKLTAIPLEEVRHEIQKNDTAIFERTGVFPRTFCYPNNAKNEEVVELASRDRVATRTKQFSLGGKATPENLEARIKKLLKTREWDIAMTHGIHYGYDAFRDPTVFWDHLDQVKRVEDKVWVGTFEEVATYIAEREATTLEVVSWGKGKLLIIPSFSLDKELFKEPLTAVLNQSGIRKITVTQDNKNLDCTVFSDKTVFDFNPQGGTIEVKFN